MKLSTSLPVELRGESYRRLTECGLVPAVLGRISQITKSLSAANTAEPNIKEMTILEPLSKIVNKVAKEERSASLEHMDVCEKLYLLVERMSVVMNPDENSMTWLTALKAILLQLSFEEFDSLR